MKKTRFLRLSAVEELRSNVAQNLDCYRLKGFVHLIADQAFWFEHSTELDDSKLSELQLPSGSAFHEAESCATVYDALPTLSPYEARDERLWAYLCHVDLLEYTRARWPIPEDDTEAVAHIRKHFFAQNKRQIERDNAVSRLWWMAHLCARLPNVDRKEALNAFLFKSDVRANIIERPTASQSIDVFQAIISKLIASYAGKKLLFERANFRRFMREVNLIGGFKLLDCMDAEQADNVVSDIISTKMGLAMI